MSENTDLGRAVSALRSKSGRYKKYWAYYEGDHPQVYTNKRFAEIFRNIEIKFNENWCAAVIDAVLDRVWLKKIRITKKSRAQSAIEKLWRDLSLGLEADDVHKAALVTGESVMVAWRDDDGQPDAYFNDPSMVHMFYYPDRPRVMRYAAKWWYDDQDDRVKLNLYYPDQIEYYRAVGDGAEIKKDIRFEERDAPVENPYGVVPFFHFRPDTRAMQSDLVNVLPLQIGINKLINDMMVAAEFASFRQKWVVSNADISSLKNAPNEIWPFPAGDRDSEPTKVGEFSATDLRNYIQAIEHFAASLSTIAAVPKHYFFNRTGTVSGEALMALESPLAKKAARRVQQFTPSWRKFAQFLLQLKGIKVDLSEIEPEWGPVESVQPLTQAKIRRENVNAGIPVITQLRWEGHTESEIETVKKEIEGETPDNRRDAGG